MEAKLDEQETTFTVEATDRNTLNIFSNDVVWQRRLEDLGIAPYRTDGYGKFYRVSLDEYNFGIHRKRQLSDEQRAAAAQRLRASRVDTTGKILA
jgi:hypothetical protein